MSVLILLGKDTVKSEFYLSTIDVKELRRIKKPDEILPTGGLFGPDPTYVIKASVKKDFDSIFDRVAITGASVIILTNKSPAKSVKDRYKDVRATERNTDNLRVKDYCPTAPASLIKELELYAGDDSSIIVSFIANYRNVGNLKGLTLEKALRRLSQSEGVVPYWEVTNILTASPGVIIEKYRRFIAGSNRKQLFFLLMLSKELKALTALSLVGNVNDSMAMSLTGIKSPYRLNNLKRIAKKADPLKLTAVAKEVSLYARSVDDAMFISPENLEVITEKLLVDITSCFD